MTCASGVTGACVPTCEQASHWRAPSGKRTLTTEAAVDALARWETQVRAAALDGDQARLRELYESGRAEFGPAADHAWALALAAFDATAVTG